MNSSPEQLDPTTPEAPSQPSPERGELVGQPSFLLTGGYALVITVVVGVAMMLPVAILTALPPPKSAGQLIAQTLEGLGIAFDAESFERGQAAFAASCVACHTPDGGAKTGLGKDIVNSEFTAGLDDDALMKFIKVGRDAGDPLNTTGVGMPAKGGDPSITAQDLRDLLVFIRSRQAEEGLGHK